MRRLSLAKLFRTGRTAGSSSGIQSSEWLSRFGIVIPAGRHGAIPAEHLHGLNGIAMKRIFLILAIMDFLALLACFADGMVFSSPGWRLAGDSATLAAGAERDSSYVVHFGLGLGSTIANLGVHCLIFIYFLGTGRWVKEVALDYKIPDVPYPRLTRDLKRRTFPPALLSMLLPVAAGGR